jgi:hypothetical protein
LNALLFGYVKDEECIGPAGKAGQILGNEALSVLRLVPFVGRYASLPIIMYRIGW